MSNPKEEMHTAVLFLVFNRPDTTKQVFEVIRQARPPRLYVGADGSRDGKIDEKGRCEEVRKIATSVDWPCEVKTLFREENLGCRRGVSGAIDWFFKHEPEGIILEDDCLPSPTFFQFCQDLLEYYRNDERVMMIGGVNFQSGWRRTDNSYYFSNYTHIWGWASWRRAWQHYDVTMSQWPFIRDYGYLKDIYKNQRLIQNWTHIFEQVYQERIDTWDYQWHLACLAQHGLCILPNINLVSNLGFNAEATHTVTVNRLANMPSGNMFFPLKHPSSMIRDDVADWRTFCFESPGLVRQVLIRIQRIARKLMNIG